MRSIEDAPWSSFVLRMFTLCSCGLFLDGYVFGSTAVATVMAHRDLRLTSWEYGLATAALLVGVFLGSSASGRVVDKLGRQRVFRCDLLVFLIASVVQVAIADFWSLVVLRLVVGVAVGVQYVLSSALMSEFSPRKSRNRLLSGMSAFWNIGYVVAYLSCYALGLCGVSWSWILATAAMPTIAVALLQIDAPESPRWLVSRNMLDEARAIVRRFYGKDYGIDDLIVEGSIRVGYLALFGRRYLTRTVFATVFYTCQATVSVATLLFLPIVFEVLGIEAELTAGLVVNAVMVAGLPLGIYLIDRWRRRTFVVWTFVIMAVLICTLAAYSLLSPWVVLFSFAAYRLVNSAAGILQFVYPPEMFPTEIRGSACGFASGVSHGISAVGTFIFPLLLRVLGATWTFAFLGAVLVFGTVISIMWAPDTKDLPLIEASGIDTL